MERTQIITLSPWLLLGDTCDRKGKNEYALLRFPYIIIALLTYQGHQTLHNISSLFRVFPLLMLYLFIHHASLMLKRVDQPEFSRKYESMPDNNLPSAWSLLQVPGLSTDVLSKLEAVMVASWVDLERRRQTFNHVTGRDHPSSAMVLSCLLPSHRQWYFASTPHSFFQTNHPA